jgi:hypothetical protein
VENCWGEVWPRQGNSFQHYPSRAQHQSLPLSGLFKRPRDTSANRVLFVVAFLGPLARDTAPRLSDVAQKSLISLVLGSKWHPLAPPTSHFTKSSRLVRSRHALPRYASLSAQTWAIETSPTQTLPPTWTLAALIYISFADSLHPPRHRQGAAPAAGQERCAQVQVSQCRFSAPLPAPPPLLTPLSLPSQGSARHLQNRGP